MMKNRTDWIIPALAVVGGAIAWQWLPSDWVALTLIYGGTMTLLGWLR